MLTHTLRGNRLIIGGALLATALLMALLVPVQRSEALIFNRLAIIRVGTPPPDTPGAREFQVVAGQGVDVVVQLQDLLFQPVPALAKKTITLRTTGPNATTFAYSKVLNAGQSSVTFTGVKWTTPYDGVILTAATTDNSATPDTSDGNVTASGATVPASTPFWSYDGQSAALATCAPTAQRPVCVELTTHGATTDQLLAFSPCDGTESCVLGSNIWTWLVGTNSATVTHEDPNLMTVKLDKTIAGGRGVTQFQLKLQLVPDGPFEAVPQCVDDGDVPAGSKFCELGRNADNAGDRIFRMAYTEDGRGIVK